MIAGLPFLSLVGLACGPVFVVLLVKGMCDAAKAADEQDARAAADRIQEELAMAEEHEALATVTGRDATDFWWAER